MMDWLPDFTSAADRYTARAYARPIVASRPRPFTGRHATPLAQAALAHAIASYFQRSVARAEYSMRCESLILEAALS